MRCSKAFVVFFVVCLLASSSVWAIPGIKKPAETPEVPDVLVVTDTTGNSESAQSAKYVTSEELLEILNKSGWVLGGSKIEKLQEGVEAISKTNLEQNLEIARLAAALKKEQSTKFFADFGAAFGFRSEMVQYGIVGDMGIRFGKGLMVKTGAQYMVGDFGKLELPTWSIENLSLTATVGWEW